jgi:ABC-type multidrug transport system fused ATPase/permease subunit
MVIIIVMIMMTSSSAAVTVAIIIVIVTVVAVIAKVFKLGHGHVRRGRRRLCSSNRRDENKAKDGYGEREMTKREQIEKRKNEEYITTRPALSTIVEFSDHTGQSALSLAPFVCTQKLP